MNKVWIISDHPETAYELAGKAKTLGTSLTAYVLGDNDVAQRVISFGADVVKLMQLPQTTVWEQYLSVLLQEAGTENPELILVASTCRGKDLAAQLAAKLDCPCVTDSKKLEEKDGKLVLQRIIYGGLAYQDIECNTFPVIVTIAPHTFEKGEPEEKQGEIFNLSLIGEGPIQVVERKAKEAASVNLAEADIVVGVGRGLTQQSGLAMFEELAKLLGGEVGCTRPIAEDLKWLPEERYLGITGKQIKPNLYLCAGVSGQIQHVYGIRESKVIVSINNNENAPIFKVSDYYIVGDLEEVIPALISALK
ncbi:electron transfer flavoprotein, alpha subunit [Pelotomaculum thermopropionicum SI]|uniref:Electron transfer flavoprotein, alpha subunit n=1 Tax=Pelotomaculum thermopropionicum (strain DSM 13744 / JCM 10971 / SI) TaxID=370438 RepID=A5CZH8_PELTS|nr:electron transfer flavoprotein, alpha subunit [Pelotomaculum thermopropionicum SI]